MSILDEQPGQSVRRDDPDTLKKRAADHRETTESPKWGPAGNSEKERGYPREGGQAPAERSRQDANPKPAIIRRPED